MENVLSVHQLTKSFDRLAVLQGVDLEIGPQQLHSVIGPNGAGKTTFFNCITGMFRPDSGRVVLGGRDVTNWSPRRLIGAGLARTFQVTNVFPGVTVRENVELAVRSRMGKNFNILRSCGTLREARDHAEEILSFAGILELAGRRADSLAHGDLRILEVAIAFGLNPKVLCLDEPTAGMGRAEIARIITLIKRLGEHASILLIEHDMDVVLSISDVITVLVSGRVLASGSPDDIQTDEAVQEAYLGKTRLFEMHTIL